MGENHHYYDEDFFKKYGWVSCYECDTIFYDIEKLIEHQEECDSNRRARENYSWELIQDMIEREVSAAFKLKEQPKRK